MSTPQTSSLPTFHLDPAHSRVGFAVRHLGFSKVRGSFQDFMGTVHMVPGELNTLEVAGSVQTATVNTGDDKRDAHLRSDDFFAVDEFPEMTFESTGVSEANGAHAKLSGNLTIRGTSKNVTFDVEFLGEATDPWGGARIALEAKANINRKEFGLKWNQVLEAGGMLVGDTVEISLEVQGVRSDGDAA